MKTKEELIDIAKEIRGIITNYQTKNELTFVEESHTYFMKGNNGEITSDMPSVSTVLESFCTPFNAEGTRAFKNCGGDNEKEKLLLETWAATGEYAANKGSRVHYLLEKELVGQYGSYKDVREPIFSCDKEQIENGDQMIKSGKNFINIMHDRGAVLLDTETVLGNIEFGYFGQPDKNWLINDNNGDVGLIITDWKTNKKSNMSDKKMPWTKQMLVPFGYLNDNAINHYKLQLPLYGKLFIKMLEGSKYENIKLLGCIIVHLTDDGEFFEYRVDNGIKNKIFEMDIKKYLK